MVREELNRAYSMSGVPPVQVLRALGRESDNPETEHWLASLLTTADESATIAVLDALSLKSGVLHETDAIFRVIRDPGRSVIERAAGVLCLERTATLDRIDEILDLTAGDPVLDYVLGRCLLCRLDTRAVLRLLAVLDASGSKAPEGVLAVAQQEARAILGNQSGMGSEAALESLRTWAAGAGEVVPVVLPPSAIAGRASRR
jgi:hypothetical protein